MINLTIAMCNTDPIGAILLALHKSLAWLIPVQSSENTTVTKRLQPSDRNLSLEDPIIQLVQLSERPSNQIFELA